MHRANEPTPEVSAAAPVARGRVARQCAAGTTGSGIHSRGRGDVHDGTSPTTPCSGSHGFHSTSVIVHPLAIVARRSSVIEASP